ncbi:molecular chaperone HscB [Candidatus Kinetoplastibacterium desouzaii TCC079E]|uniref:Co-chaperone protein HscB homolog n=1 Tax=Candidatus Kinetoplastidibacterium desouzai TCC079E TaxID=1208919 RepID=M1L232_9PROT|nr:Fe-S protein assembly co-chaperone HscB [Candidatus Kinetoplastibacterium desouzaii]AGF46808.1 molecular chaperone HscB [Candidatus Kinetoplastibacterium desouzaii TCC079E]
MINYSNYFKLFGLDFAFEIEEEKLDKAWRKISNFVHPDRHRISSSMDQMAAIKLSSFVNNAYSILSNPIKRAQYICEYNGINFNNNIDISKDFLSKQLEWRESLELIFNQKDLSILNEFISSLSKEMRERFEILCELLDNNIDYKKASLIIKELMFIDKIMQEAISYKKINF